MEIFPPAGLPGVGMGDLVTIVGIGGLIGLATTSGMLLAEGLIGVVLYTVAALAVLSQAGSDLGGSPTVVAVVLALVAGGGAWRAWTLHRRESTTTAPAGGTPAAAAPAAAAAPTMLERLADLLVVAAGSASVGLAWAEWDEIPFAVDGEAVAGIVLALVCGALGAVAARSFVSGAVRVGGARLIVGATVVLVTVALNVAGFYLPFVGYLALVLAALYVVRSRRRAGTKYKGLRILS